MSTFDDLDEATRQYRACKAALEEAQEATVKAVLDALRAGERPTDVVERSPFTAAYVRRLAREAGIEAAKPGPKAPARHEQ